MEKLYYDDYVKAKGFNSTEEYIKSCLEKHLLPMFNHINYFDSLFDKGILKDGVDIETVNEEDQRKVYTISKKKILVGPYPRFELSKPFVVLNNGKSIIWRVKDIDHLVEIFEIKK